MKELNKITINQLGSPNRYLREKDLLNKKEFPLCLETTAKSIAE